MSKREIQFQQTEVLFLPKLPGQKRIAQALEFSPEIYFLIYDKKLSSHPEVKTWLKEFKYTYPVSAGEGLKDIDDLPHHMKKIFKMLGPVSPRSLCVITLGGGTVGDFGGFIASIFKRGVELVHIPSTILAAIDSAHGGKTALNVGSFKNQIGSFYPAKAVVLVRDLFEGLPAVQIRSAVGELAKMALISGGELYEKIKMEKVETLDGLWAVMPLAIQAKYRVVEKDPLERIGERQVLNLGHTLGHVLESYYELPHGIAVGLGLTFAARWSHHRGYLSSGLLQELLDVLHGPLQIQTPEDFFRNQRRMSKEKMEKLLAQDKKLKDSGNIHFIFLDKVGGAFRKSVTLESLSTEADRQEWVV